MTQAIILAAGKGTRINAKDTNKCLFPIGGKPMIRYPLEALRVLGIKKPIVVVGFARESIQKALGDSVVYAVQEEANGTAKALEAGVAKLAPDVSQVIVLYGDHSAFYNADVLKNLIDTHTASRADMTLVTVVMSNPTGYGRIVRDAQGNLVKIVEEKNATDAQRAIKEINSGNGMYACGFLRDLLPKIEANELTKEYYLTDILKLGLEGGYKVETLVSRDESLSMGVNTPEQLAAAEAHMRSLQSA